MDGTNVPAGRPHRQIGLRHDHLCRDEMIAVLVGKPSISELARVQPQGTHPMSWAVDVVLAMRVDDRALSHELAHLIPLAQVVVWAQGRKQLPTPDELRDRFQVHRSTAFRWLPHLRRARETARP
jgi:hypothetical protein